MHDWKYFFKHLPLNTAAGSYRIFEPEWKAEILHWLGSEDVGKEQKEELIKALINFHDGCGKFYRYRAYFLAAEAVAKFSECSLGDEIVGQVLKWSYGYFRQDKRDWQIPPQPLVETARAILELTDRKRVIAAFVKLVHRTESRYILRVAAEKLGKLEPGNNSAVAALVLLNCDKAITSLGEMGRGNKDAIASLTNYLQTRQNDDINFVVGKRLWEVAKSLWQIDPGNAIVIATLIKILATTQDGIVLMWVAKYLAEIDPGNKDAIAVLTQRLESTVDEYFLSLLAGSFILFDPDNRAEQIILQQMLIDSKSECDRFYIAESLLHINPHHQLAIQTLFNLIQNLGQTCLYPESAKYVVWEVVCILEKIDPSHQLAIKTLVNLLQNAQANFEHLDLAIGNLGEIASGNQAAISALTKIINSITSPFILTKAAYNLAKIDPGNQLAISTLTELAKIDNSWYTANLLAEIVPANETAITTLIQFIETYPIPIFDNNKIGICSEYLSDEYYFIKIAKTLKASLQSKHLSQVIITLKGYLSEEYYRYSYPRYEAVYNLIWHCAQKMNYPDFYTAWHQ